MASEPLARLDLAAASVADDVGFVALADITASIGKGITNYRLIGGRMVQIHVHRWRLGPDLYRETADVDVGLEPVLLGDARLEEALVVLGYRRESGNRFVRELDDIPVITPNDHEVFRATIDVLVPERGEPRPRPRTVGGWTVDVAPGLSLAMRRDPISVELGVRRLNGERLSIACLVPDELSALALKLGSWRTRFLDTDAVDLWRCLEVLAVVGTQKEDFDSRPLARFREELNETILGHGGEFVAREIGNYRGLDRDATRRLLVRLRALTQRITGGSGSAPE